MRNRNFRSLLPESPRSLVQSGPRYGVDLLLLVPGAGRVSTEKGAIKCQRKTPYTANNCYKASASKLTFGGVGSLRETWTPEPPPGRTYTMSVPDIARHMLGQYWSSHGMREVSTRHRTAYAMVVPDIADCTRRPYAVSVPAGRSRTAYWRV
eukprot:3581449-Rhodomonas_salina.1